MKTFEALAEASDERLRNVNCEIKAPSEFCNM